jgi:hypothetical protein
LCYSSNHFVYIGAGNVAPAPVTWVCATSTAGASITAAAIDLRRVTGFMRIIGVLRKLK